MTATNTTGADLASGAALLSFAIATTQDTVVEATENFTVTLGSATATVVNPTITTSITDDDTSGDHAERSVDGCGRRPDQQLHGEPDQWCGAWCRPERDVYA